MKINNIINYSFKGITVKKTGSTTPVRKTQQDNLKQAEKTIDIMSTNANNAINNVDWHGIKTEEAPNFEAKGLHSGEKVYLKRIDDYIQIEDELKKTTPQFENMLQALQNTIKLNIDVDKQNQVYANQHKTLEATAKQNNATSLSRIAGYDYEMDILREEFINKVLLEKKGEESCNIPGSVLFFGPNRNGKTLITQAVAEATKADIVKIKDNEYDTSNFIPKLYAAAEKSEQSYTSTGKRTIIFIDEADKFLSNSKSNINEFYKFIKNCSNDYHCTVFLATNKPLELGADFNDPDIFPIVMSIDPANHENKLAIVKKIIQTYKIKSLNIKKIVSAIEKKEKELNRVYSNEQIVNIARDLGEDIVLQKTDKKEALNYLEQNILPKYNPDIEENDIVKFLKEYDIIINRAGVENEDNND